MEEEIIDIEDLLREDYLDNLPEIPEPVVYYMPLESVVKYHNPLEQLRNSIFNFTRPHGHS